MMHDFENELALASRLIEESERRIEKSLKQLRWAENSFEYSSDPTQQIEEFVTKAETAA